MSDKHENSSFWKWLAIAALAAIVIFGLGYCNPFNKTFNDFKYNKKHIEQNHDGTSFEEDFPNHINKTSDINGNQLKSYYTIYPSNRYHVQVDETLQQLAYRLHISVHELKQRNPELKPIAPNEPVSKDEVIDVPEKVQPSQFEAQVVKLTNEARAREGLPALKADYAALNSCAVSKARDMADKNYFDHNSPTYGSPFEMMKQFGISYTSAAENIAKGQKTPQEVVNAWLNSAGHRANIMNRSLNKIGVGYNSKGDIWVQQFVQK